MRFIEHQRLAALFLCLTLGACAGRTPAPVAVVQDRDQNADCATITAEIQSNTQQIAELGREDGAKVAQNVVAGVAGVFVPVLWFAMDFQDASGKEGRALSQRNQYLSQIAARRCTRPTVVITDEVRQ